MLVVSRYVDQEIEIGGGIRVVIVAVEGQRVKVGVDAPREVPVHRREVAQEIQRQQPLERFMPPRKRR